MVIIDLDSSLIKFVENGWVFMFVELFSETIQIEDQSSIDKKLFPCKVPLYFATFQITFYSICFSCP